jgi:hypothetical protein
MKLYENFLNPEKHIAFYPAWYPSDHLGESDINKELDNLLSYSIRGLLINPCRIDKLVYFSEEWFERLKLILKSVQEKGLYVYLYDDQLSPGGIWSKKISQKYLHLNAVQLYMDSLTAKKQCHNLEKETLASFLASDYSFSVRYMYQQLHVCNEYYLDVLNKNLLSILKKEYLSQLLIELGSFFGKTIQGIVYKEHGLTNCRKTSLSKDELPPLPWSLDFPAYFKQKTSYSILEHLSLLWKADHLLARKVRRDYYQAIFCMYRENFAIPLKEFFASYQLKIAGHLDYEDILQNQSIVQRDFMLDQQIFDYAGLHQTEFNKSNVPEKLLSSANHIEGKIKTFSANLLLDYQGSSIATMKQWTDRQFSNGINSFFFHGVSIYDFLLHQNWKHFSLYSQYLQRFSFLCQQSCHVASVGLYYPLDNILSLYKPKRWNEANRTVYEIRELCDTLLQHQVEFDFVDSRALINSSIDQSKLITGMQVFRVLIFARCKHLKLAELIKISEFVESGGSVIFSDSLPEECLEIQDIATYKQLFDELLRSENVYTFLDSVVMSETMKMPQIYKILDVLDQAASPLLRLQDHDPELRIQHRKQTDLDIFIVSNLSHNHKHNALIFSCPEHLEVWSMETGLSQPLRYRYHEKKDRVMFHLYPYQTTVYVNFKKPRTSYSPTVVLQNGIYQLLKTQMVVDGIPAEFLLRGEWSINFSDKRIVEQLKPWEAMQFSHFQDVAIYEKVFSLPGEYLNFNLLLDLGSVRDCAEVTFNGRPIGVRMWEPYRFLLHYYARKENNVLQIKVSHTLSPMVSRDRVSGLLGPVRLLPYKKI